MEFSLLIKKIKNQLSEEEELEFDKWYNESKNHRLYFQKVKSNYSNEELLINEDKAWNKIEIKLSKRIHQRFRWQYALAAILVIALGTTFYFNNFQNSSIPKSVTPLENKIVLTTEDGTEVNLTAAKSYQRKNVIGAGKQLRYLADSSAPQKISYNYLTIPRGELFTITLSDNTIIWLNSDTKIKFPVQFKHDEPRLVEVIYGEAFFDVTPSSANNEMNFLVKTGKQTIEVLGTEFNVKAYKEDTQITTTLAEGTIVLSNQLTENKNVLKPGLQSIFDPANMSWLVQEVNVSTVTSWKEGVFTFKDKDLKEIMVVLSRWYDINVDFSDKSLESLKFNGVIRRSQNLEDILNILQETGKVQYEITNQKITIKEKSEMRKSPE